MHPLPATCFSLVFWSCNFIGCNPDPTQVNAKASTNFFWEKGFHLLSVLVVVVRMHLSHHKTTLQCFSVPSNSGFMFYWFWERKSLRNPKSKSETCSVFYTENSKYSCWSRVRELHVSWGAALFTGKFLLCFSIAGRRFGVRELLWVQQCKVLKSDRSLAA